MLVAGRACRCWKPCRFSCRACVLCRWRRRWGTRHWIRGTTWDHMGPHGTIGHFHPDPRLNFLAAPPWGSAMGVPVMGPAHDAQVCQDLSRWVRFQKVVRIFHDVLWCSYIILFILICNIYLIYYIIYYILYIIYYILYYSILYFILYYIIYYIYIILYIILYYMIWYDIIYHNMYIYNPRSWCVQLFRPCGTVWCGGFEAQAWSQLLDGNLAFCHAAGWSTQLMGTHRMIGSMKSCIFA